MRNVVVRIVGQGVVSDDIDDQVRRSCSGSCRACGQWKYRPQSEAHGVGFCQKSVTDARAWAARARRFRIGGSRKGELVGAF
jgi:hypothetical protein